jgi:integrase/recombinase XerD
MSNDAEILRGGPPLQLKLSDWPAPDRLALAVACDPGDVLDRGGPASRWAAASRRTVMKAYGRWLSWLESTGVPAIALAPCARVTPERVSAYIADLRAHAASMTVASYLQGLAMAMHAMAPASEWGWLWDIVNRLKRSVVPSRNKRARLVPSRELVALGIELMNEAADGGTKGPQYEAGRYRDGLMIALLAARPYRLRNFASIEIGRHLIQIGGRHYLRFEAAETKTHKAMELPFPKGLVAYLQNYLTFYRPLLLMGYGHTRVPNEQAATMSGLWISIFGNKMPDVSVHGRVVELTRRKFGHSINPHLFRDCAATSIATEDPQQAHIIMTILGHATLATSERYYNHASSLKANSAHQTNILALRRAGAKHARSERRRHLQMKA